MSIRYQLIQLCKLDYKPQIFKRGEYPDDHQSRIQKVRDAIQTLPKGATVSDLENLFDDAQRGIMTPHTLLKTTWTVNGDIYVECVNGGDDVIDGCVKVFGYTYRKNIPVNFSFIKDGSINLNNIK